MPWQQHFSLSLSFTELKFNLFSYMFFEMKSSALTRPDRKSCQMFLQLLGEQAAAHAACSVLWAAP